MRGRVAIIEHFRENGHSLRPAGEKVARAQAVTDEGDHGGAPVIGGPLGTAAPTNSIVTRRRGGCPHPPVRGPLHPTIPTLIRPFGAPSPWEGEGFIRSDATAQSPSAFPSSAPVCSLGHLPPGEGFFRLYASSPNRDHLLAPVIFTSWNWPRADLSPTTRTRRLPGVRAVRS